MEYLPAWMFLALTIVLMAGFPVTFTLMGTALVFGLIGFGWSFFNLLPLPPLDGGRVMTGLLPGPWAYQFSRIEPYGFFILIGLLVTGVLGLILWPLISFVMSMLVPVSGLSLQHFQLVLLALMGGG